MKGIKLHHTLVQHYQEGNPSTRQKSSIWEREVRLGPVVKMKDRQRLYHMLGILLGSGLGIMDSLEVILDQTKKKALKTLLEMIKSELETGSPLSDCMDKQQSHFSPFEIQTIRMGEQTGQMHTILQSLSEFYEKKIRLKRKVVQALSYPIAVIVIAILVLSFMIAFVVPMFKDIFQRFDAELPAITQQILKISEVFTEQLGWILLGGIIIAGATFFVKKQAGFRKIMSRIMLKIPILGPLMLKLQLSRFCFTFALLLRSKINMDKSLALLNQIIPFFPIQQAIHAIRKEVIEGSTLYEAFCQHSIFPRYITQIVKVGEKTAQLEGLFEKLGRNLEEESETGVSQLTQFLEPLLIIVLGVMVGIILVAMYLPMFELSHAIG